MLARTRFALGPESLLVALLGLYHVALAVGPEQPWGRGLWLAHIGLLILWQPFVETGRRLSVAELALMGAGWLIEQAGWKGRNLGPAGMYEKQALVLVNRGGATGADVGAVMGAVQASVREKFGVGLTPEPIFL